MTIDTEAMRKKIQRSAHILRPAIVGEIEFITPNEALQMVEEIERLRYYLEEIKATCDSGVDESSTTLILVKWALMDKPRQKV